MRIRMSHRVTAIVAAVVGLCFAELAVGAMHGGSGSVHGLVIAESYYGPNADYFVLDGLTALGTCAKQGDGLVVLRLKDDAKGERQFSFILQAKMAGIPVSVDADDTEVDAEGYCFVRHVY